MKPIGILKKGPAGIVAKFNELSAALNSLQVTGTYPITVTVTDTGWLIQIADPTKAPAAGAPAGAAPSGDAGGGGGSDSALAARVAVLEAILAGADWGAVDVMSTACVRSTIHVLSK